MSVAPASSLPSVQYDKHDRSTWAAATGGQTVTGGQTTTTTTTTPVTTTTTPDPELGQGDQSNINPSLQGPAPNGDATNVANSPGQVTFVDNPSQSGSSAPIQSVQSLAPATESNRQPVMREGINPTDFETFSFSRTLGSLAGLFAVCIGAPSKCYPAIIQPLNQGTSLVQPAQGGNAGVQQRPQTRTEQPPREERPATEPAPVTVPPLPGIQNRARSERRETE